jgi:hypothetical protein
MKKVCLFAGVFGVLAIAMALLGNYVSRVGFVAAEASPVGIDGRGCTQGLLRYGPQPGRDRIAGARPLQRGSRNGWRKGRHATCRPAW